METRPEGTPSVSTHGTHDDWSLPLAILFGGLGLPLMLVAGYLWLEPWTEIGFAGLGVASVYVVAMGLAFWYLAGLAWGWPGGLVGPGAGALVVGLPLALVSRISDGGPVEALVMGCAGAAIAGVVAYPLGLLVRWALGPGDPVLGLVIGGLLLALGLVVILTTAPPPDGASPVFAPATLFAGAGTLAVVIWSLVRRASSGPTATLTP